MTDLQVGKAFSLSCLFVLAACASQPGPVPETGAPPVAPPPAEPEPVAPISPPPAADPVIPELTNLTAAEVQYELGVPTLVRRDGTVQVMLYESGFCVLDLTLTEDGPDDYYRVRHAAARDRSGAPIDFETCVGNFLLDPYGAGAVR